MEMMDITIATVDYRLALGYPFPTAIEDGADAVLWIVSQADRLGIDVDRGIVISGFSAEANLAFTVPLKLHQLNKDVHIAGIISWYPPTNYTLSRPERNATNPRPEAGLPGYLTSLFDQSYLHPSGCESDILVSPALAMDEQLTRALLRDIWIYTCEYDDLCDEGKKFAERLGKFKIVRYNMIPGVPHAWDKAPNSLWVNEIAREKYHHAVMGLKELWGFKLDQCSLLD